MSRPVQAVTRDPRRNNAPICTGKWPDGNPCKLIAVKGKAVCRRHGGKSLEGVAHPNYRTGRYSKHLPTQLAQRAEEARANPELLSLRDDIAVIEARLAECLATVREGDTPAFWRELRRARAAFQQAFAAGDIAGIQAADQTVERLIRDGGNQAAAWTELRKLWETRAKLVQTEVKTLQSLQQMVSVQQMQLHLGALTNVVIEACEKFADPVTKRKLLQHVLGEFTKLSTLEEKRPARDVTPVREAEVVMDEGAAE